MKISDLITSVFKNTDRSIAFKFQPNVDDGAYFLIEPSYFKKIENGAADIWPSNQYIFLKTLVEQAEAEIIPNGFIVPAEVLTRLDQDSRDVLALPPLWDGSIYADIKGNTEKANFGINLSVKDPDGNKSYSYEIIGPIIKFGKSSEFLLSSAQLNVFTAKAAHDRSQQLEFDNLSYIYRLQESKNAGAKINLAHFDKLEIHTPSNISIEGEVDADGDLILTPYMGQKASHSEIERVLGQFHRGRSTTLKVGKEIILFDEEKIKAIYEILQNRVIKKDQIKTFMKTPTAFLDANLVDLDSGLSLRVHGAVLFKHAYFGDTDNSGIDWFGKSSDIEKLYSFITLSAEIKDNEALEDLKAITEDAQKVGAPQITFEEKQYDIRDEKIVELTLSKIKTKLNKIENDAESGSGDGVSASKEKLDQIVVDINLNDESLTEKSDLVETKINDICRKEELIWDNYLRRPFPHQKLGVQWILGMIDESQRNERITGALLADDMGLGKTYMALAAVEKYYCENKEQNRTLKPTLIVAPLSLLEVWKEEVAKTFKNSPFKDIVVLQSQADLNKFRFSGVETRGKVDEGGEVIANYSLRVGKNFGLDRLDIPERLIITTYQTLRDYMFSLCNIDFGIIVFDEAQNIKDPNALQTRAAKGLKAEFKLVATGTPVENSLTDFWCLLDTACPGYLGAYQDFRAKYVTPIVQAAGDEIGEIRARLGRELRTDVGALMLRRLKEDNLEGLPKKHMFVGIKDDVWKYMEVLGRTMRGKQLQCYDDAIQALAESDEQHVLKTLLRLRNGSLHPSLMDGGSISVPNSLKELHGIFEESEKLTSLLLTLDNIRGLNEKCIIFAVNKRLQNFLSLALSKKYGLGPLSVINGDTKAVSNNPSTLTRKKLIEDFELKEGFNIIIMSPVAAGVGLTVVGANHVIHFERHWNPAKEAQATDRVYRIGQQKDVNIYLPILLHPKMESFDVNLHHLLSKKTLLKDAVVTPEDVIPNPAGLGAGLVSNDTSIITFNDVKKLSWQQFEALALEILAKELGADSLYLTNDGADAQADGLILTSNSLSLIQVKHTKGKSYNGGYKAIREVYGSKPTYEKHFSKPQTDLFFITNATRLSAKAKEVAKDCSVEIIDGNKLEDLIRKHNITFIQIISRLDQERYIV